MCAVAADTFAKHFFVSMFELSCVSGRLLASANFVGRLQSEISIRNSDELDSCSPTAAARKEE